MNLSEVLRPLFFLHCFDLSAGGCCIITPPPPPPPRFPRLSCFMRVVLFRRQCRLGWLGGRRQRLLDNAGVSCLMTTDFLTPDGLSWRRHQKGICCIPTCILPINYVLLAHLSLFSVSFWDTAMSVVRVDVRDVRPSTF